ncbi:hypothetical protein CERZMDRAFT_93029 [Cercospora zeae-maydis SCOH1-5]|uniref:Protein kinase domain-containing protein n=1 Tax=Cercospora zeae-maydis SCOH1-5 TaxID=717836 RepID=A0A6A6FU44_9PEZI|nr:hypothetical protein CERZMDRAFT_93029 [Cercospora zeae-maydis SCOH1-5]
MTNPPLEEQTLPRFHDRPYYPMELGQTLHSRYSIISKLGYGASSTVWLARDRQTNQYRAVKNILLSASSDSVFQRIEQQELDEPSVPTIVAGRYGPYPVYASRGQLSFAKLFDEEGNWSAGLPVPSTSFKEFVTVLPAEEKEVLKFIRKMLTWDPAQRATPAELFKDQWLTAPFEHVVGEGA